MEFRNRFLLAAIAALVIVGCNSGQPEGPDALAQTTTAGVNDASAALGPTMATVDGQPIYESVFRLYSLNRLQKSVDDLKPEERDALMEQLKRLEVLAGAAEARGLQNDRKIAAELELQRIQSMARYMAARYLQENPATETELRDAYEKNLDHFAATQYKARHILLKSEADAKAVIDQLKKGADFAELARSKSTGPSGPNGGDLGWFSADSMVAPFANAVRQMKVGSYSTEPVETQFGWHVILLEDKKEQQAPGLDAVRREVTNIVSQQKIEEFSKSLMSKGSSRN